ncbi:MAG: DUF1761 domain-containing protein [Phycisphaerae bacterium]
MEISFVAVKPLAIILAAVVAFVIGGIWYGALFGKTWPKLHGYEGEKLDAMAKSQAKAFGIMFAAEVVMAIGLAILIGTFGIHSATGGAMLGFLLWAAVGITETALQNAAHRKSLAAYAIDVGHQLLYLLAAGAIIGWFAPTA